MHDPTAHKFSRRNSPVAVASYIIIVSCSDLQFVTTLHCSFEATMADLAGNLPGFKCSICGQAGFKSQKALDGHKGGAHSKGGLGLSLVPAKRPPVPAHRPVPAAPALRAGGPAPAQPLPDDDGYEYGINNGDDIADLMQVGLLLGSAHPNRPISCSLLCHIHVHQFFVV